MAEAKKTPTINLNTLSNFELNKLTVESYCIGQRITFEPQKPACEFTDLMDNKCYFITPSGNKRDFDFALSDHVSGFISKYKINIHHGENNVTVSSTEYPEITQITLEKTCYRKAVCYIVIMIADRYKKQYTA